MVSKDGENLLGNDERQKRVRTGKFGTGDAVNTYTKLSSTNAGPLSTSARSSAGSGSTTSQTKAPKIQTQTQNQIIQARKPSAAQVAVNARTVVTTRLKQQQNHHHQQQLQQQQQRPAWGQSNNAAVSQLAARRHLASLYTVVPSSKNARLCSTNTSNSSIPSENTVPTAVSSRSILTCTPTVIPALPSDAAGHSIGSRTCRRVPSSKSMKAEIASMMEIDNPTETARNNQSQKQQAAFQRDGPIKSSEAIIKRRDSSLLPFRNSSVQSSIPRLITPSRTPSTAVSVSAAAMKFVRPAVVSPVPDPLFLSEYADEIYEYMREIEIKTTPNPQYILLQPSVSWSIRRTLVNWLIGLHSRLFLLPETLFLAVNLMDRFMSMKANVAIEKFQLVGVTAMFVAAKYEEIQVPSVHRLVELVGSGYTAEEILKAENFMLDLFKFGISYNGPCSLLKRVLRVEQKRVAKNRSGSSSYKNLTSLRDSAIGENDEKQDNDNIVRLELLTKYFLEIALIEHNFLNVVPSLMVAASVFLGKHVLRMGGWTLEHINTSGYRQEQILECANGLYAAASCVREEDGVYTKYSDA
ncbi:hypothetical protein HK100_008240, partial [Physocladia obscura]